MDNRELGRLISDERSRYSQLLWQSQFLRPNDPDLQASLETCKEKITEYEAELQRSQSNAAGSFLGISSPPVEENKHDMEPKSENEPGPTENKLDKEHVEPPLPEKNENEPHPRQGEIEILLTPGTLYESLEPHVEPPALLLDQPPVLSIMPAPESHPPKKIVESLQCHSPRIVLEGSDDMELDLNTLPTTSQNGDSDDNLDFLENKSVDEDDYEGSSQIVVSAVAQLQQRLNEKHEAFRQFELKHEESQTFANLKIEDLNREVENLKDIISLQTTEIETLTSQLEQASQSKTVHEETKLALQRSKEELEALRTVHSGLELQMKQIQSHNQSLNDEIQALTQAKNEIQSAFETTKSELSNQCNSLIQQLKDAQDENLQRQRQLCENKDSFMEVSEKMEALSQGRKESLQENERLINEIARFDSVLDEVKKEAESVKTQNEHLLSRKQDLKFQLRAMTTEARLQNERNEAFMQQIEALKEKMEAANQMIEQGDKEIARMKESHAEVSKKLKLLQKEKKALEEKENETREKLKGIHEEIKVLKKEMSEKDELIKELKKKVKHVDEKDKQIVEKDQLIKDLGKKKTKELAEKEKAIQEKEKGIEERDKTIKELKREQKKFNTKIQKMSEEVEASQKIMEEHKAQQLEIETLKKEMEKLIKSKKDAEVASSKDLEKVNKEMEKLNKELDKLNGAYKEVQEENQQLKGNQRKLEQEIQALRVVPPVPLSVQVEEPSKKRKKPSSVVELLSSPVVKKAKGSEKVEMILVQDAPEPLKEKESKSLKRKERETKKDQQPSKRTKKDEAESKKTSANKNTPKELSPAPKVKKSVVIAFSGLKDETEKETLIAIAEGLGATVIEDFESPYLTHVVSPLLSKTMKILAAVLTNRWIMSPEWLKQSSTKGSWLPEEDYGRRTPEVPFMDQKVFISDKYKEQGQRTQLVLQLMKICEANVVDSAVGADFLFLSETEESAFEHVKDRVFTWKSFLESVIGLLDGKKLEPTSPVLASLPTHNKKGSKSFTPKKK